MKRTAAEQDFHEKLAHTEWLANWIAQEPEPRWVKGTMLMVLVSFCLAMALWVFVAWATR